MEIQTADELFQKMVKRPIHFSRKEDFYGFFQILYEKFPERLFRSWRTWEFSDTQAIGINPWNQQICCANPCYQTIEWEEVAHLFQDTFPSVDVSDLI